MENIVYFYYIITIHLQALLPILLIKLWFTLFWFRCLSFKYNAFGMLEWSENPSTPFYFLLFLIHLGIEGSIVCLCMSIFIVPPLSNQKITSPISGDLFLMAFFSRPFRVGIEKEQFFLLYYCCTKDKTISYPHRTDF